MACLHVNMPGAAWDKQLVCLQEPHAIHTANDNGIMVQVKFVKSNTLAMARIQVEKLICIEKFENVPQLGRFTLRDEGRTIAIGKIERLPKSARA